MPGGQSRPNKYTGLGHNDAQRHFVQLAGRLQLSSLPASRRPLTCHILATPQPQAAQASHVQRLNNHGFTHAEATPNKKYASKLSCKRAASSEFFYIVLALFLADRIPGVHRVGSLREGAVSASTGCPALATSPSTSISEATGRNVASPVVEFYALPEPLHYNNDYRDKAKM